MPLNINTSNYINTQTGTTSSSQATPSSVNIGTSDGAVVSVKGLDLQAGQTLSGQVVEIDGKDIKLLLSNNQTINAKLEGNINALLGQVMSFEVKNSDNGQTALRPLYTNLDNSQTVSNALQNAGLPVTDNYAKMVSSMMDEGMPINKNAINDMSRQVNSFPAANPETVVKLNKLGLQINELTINQYENYKGLEHKIIGDVDNLSKGLTDLMKDSLSDITKTLGDTSVEGEALQLASETAEKASSGKNLLSAFFNAITGQDVKTEVDESSVLSEGRPDSLTEAELSESQNITEKNEIIDKSAFDTARLVLDMVDTDSIDESDKASLSKELTDLVKDIANSSDIEEAGDLQAEVQNGAGRTEGRSALLRSFINELDNNSKTDASFNELKNVIQTSDNVSGRDALVFIKDLLSKLNTNPEKFSEITKQKLAQAISDKDFSSFVKDNITKQMLLKPEEVVNSKNIEDLYSKIVKQADQALHILENSGKDNPELLNAAKNISDNVNFMNELSQVATYVQLPLLMNNKSTHGDLYVYTNKKSLKNNDGNISALLHLDMDNLGPMDIYVKLTSGTKLNTHFYLQDEAAIDFIESHIDILNKRLTDKGYDMSTNISVKDKTKKAVNMADEFLKDDPSQEMVSASKFSFDVRA